jgi:hypothetical protein
VVCQIIRNVESTNVFGNFVPPRDPDWSIPWYYCCVPVACNKEGKAICGPERSFWQVVERNDGLTVGMTSLGGGQWLRLIIYRPHGRIEEER